MPTDISKKKRKTSSTATLSAATDDSKLHQEIDRLKKENAKLLHREKERCDNCDKCQGHTYIKVTQDILEERWDKVI
jgi:hypothetical protein